MTQTGNLPDEIKNLLGNGLGLEVRTVETDLFEAGVLDSMSFVELLVQLESAYGIFVAFDDIDFENFRTVEKIAGFVASHECVHPV